MTEKSEIAPLLPPVYLALAPVIFLVITLGTSILLFGDSTTGGPGQIALLLAGITAGAVGVKQGVNWSQLEKATAIGISKALPAIFILLMVGTLVGVWMLSGTVPFLIYWGLQIIAPEIFYVATVIICAIVAVSIGSSWTTAGTVGVALIGIASAAGMSKSRGTAMSKSRGTTMSTSPMLELPVHPAALAHRSK